MAETISLPFQPNYEPNNFITAVQYPTDSSIVNFSDPISGVDDEIPTVDYMMLFSDDPHQRSNALRNLGQVCQDYGFFYLVNHGVPDGTFEEVFKGIYDFFERTEEEERRSYGKKHPTDKIRWGLRSSSVENREYLKVVAHPQFHCPSIPHGFSEAMEDYFKRTREVVVGLGKAVSITLGLEEDFIEKAFKLDSGFDVSAMNLYPPNFKSKGSVGVPDHTDPGFFVSLIQDVNGGLQIQSHDQGKWINVNMPHNAIFINLGDHLEYKSHIHRVVVDNNKVKRVSVATLHGPSLDSFVAPTPEFVDSSRPSSYHGMTYKDSLEAHGGHEIDVQSSLSLLRL